MFSIQLQHLKHVDGQRIVALDGATIVFRRFRYIQARAAA
jgi:hypothetical protein